MDLSIKYLGYTLKNPIIIGSSGLTNSVEKIKVLEENNAGAVVLKSLFEEQILQDASIEAENYLYPEAYDYIKEYSMSNGLDKYLRLIEDARKEVSIPIIASINARTNGDWTDFAKKVESAGAHAIELNIGILPTDINQECSKIEELHLKILEKVKKSVSIPIAVKISFLTGGLAHLIKQIAWSKTADAIVMFNRFYNPDIDLDKMEVTVSNVLSNAEDIMPSLRWIALLSDLFDIQFVGSTGIFTAEGVIKEILAGADAVQVVSAIYKHGPTYINTLIEQLKDWMQNKGFDKISDFKGKMSMANLKNPEVYERIQFMKYYGNFE